MYRRKLRHGKAQSLVGGRLQEGTGLLAPAVASRDHALTTAFIASLCRKEGSPWLRGELGLSQSNRAALVGIHPSIYRPFIKSE